jgi:hypothetical protein
VDAREEESAVKPRHDPAAPHTGPFPHHIPRWLAWLLLAAFATSGALCARMALGG